MFTLQPKPCLVSLPSRRVATSPLCLPLSDQVIRKFRDEELEHHDIGLDHDAELVGTCLLLPMPGVP